MIRYDRVREELAAGPRLGLINQGMQFRLLGLHLERVADIVTATPDASVGAALLSDINGAIRLSGVSFRYGAADPLIFEGVSLDIASGDLVAITGASGSGKSTLLKLVLGLHPPMSGTIDLDGHRATPELWRAWRRHVGVVMQDDKLLSGTLADNIAFFDPDLDMDRVMLAAKVAQVHDDIMRSPMQYLSLVGDMGTTLSAGQRQRVLLARALYRRPKLLILDEGTANLDEETESAIFDLITQMPITRIIAAHRPTFIRKASKVFRIEARQVSTVPSSAAQHTEAKDVSSRPSLHVLR